MKHIVTFSGGKDSLAVVIWAYSNLKEFDIIFCDTGWEHPLTYLHIEEIEKKIGIPVIRLANDKYDGLEDLFIKKGRSASTKARFCTEELKMKPSIDYILSLNDDVTIYQGVRNNESTSRSNMKMKDEYFKFYFEPYGYDKKGNPKYHTYRKKEVFAYCDKYTVDAERPIIKWNANQVFEYIYSSGFEPNPLYKMGFSRVGCFPCIMCRHDEVKAIIERFPETMTRIKSLEETMTRTFFPPGYIPDEYCSASAVTKKGKVVKFPTIDDVVRYLSGDPNQLKLFTQEKKSCVSVYNICEQ